MGTRKYNHRNGNNPFHEIATLYKRKVVGNKQKNKKKKQKTKTVKTAKNSTSYFYIIEKQTFIIQYMLESYSAAQKMRFSIKGFSSKYDQIPSFLWMRSHLLKKSLMQDFSFCPVFAHRVYSIQIQVHN